MSRRAANATDASASARCTALTVSTIGVLHAAWARGSTFPFRTRRALADAVIGRDVTPGPVACGAVAVLLGTAAGVVLRADRRRDPLSRIAATGVALVLAIRSAFGFAGRTASLVPGSESPRFRRLDRVVYAPTCALLAAGAANAARRPPWSRAVGRRD